MSNKTLDELVEMNECKNKIEKTKHYCEDEWGNEFVFKTSPLLDDLFGRLEKIINKLGGIQSNIDSKALPLLRRNVDYSKSIEKRLVIIEEKLLVIYAMLEDED